MASIQYDKVDKIYADGTKALHSFELDVLDGEFMVFVGPSGCGKSTALRMTAGLEEISRGRLLIGGQVVNDKSPQERNIAMVFQDYALYPHMTVRGNMGFALRMMGFSKDEIRKRVDDAADRLSLRALLDRKPKNLSGGQRQRVAMGRALVREPKVFLLDEPLSNLDAKLRVQMRAEIAGLQKQLGVTSLYVTHDQVEAMTMGDRVAVLKGGRLQQCAPPQELYDAPQNTFVAAFIGSPRMNLFKSTLQRHDDGSASIAFGEHHWRVDRDQIGDSSPIWRAPEGAITVGLRPESLSLDAEAPEGLAIDATAEVVEMLGNETLVNFSAPVEAAIEDDGRDGMPGAEGTASFISGANAMPMVARLVPPVRLRENTEIRLKVNPEGLYLFDANGQAVH